MPRHERVNLNRATAEELEILPGIGPAKASAIVRWRSEHGRFRKLEDVLGVPGIGPATLERLRALVVVRP
jgi:competence protein ComEA